MQSEVQLRVAPLTVDKVVSIHENAHFIMTALYKFNTSSDHTFKAYKLLKTMQDYSE